MFRLASTSTTFEKSNSVSYFAASTRLKLIPIPILFFGLRSLRGIFWWFLWTCVLSSLSSACTSFFTLCQVLFVAFVKSLKTSFEDSVIVRSCAKDFFALSTSPLIALFVSDLWTIEVSGRQLLISYSLVYSTVFFLLFLDITSTRLRQVSAGSSLSGFKKLVVEDSLVWIVVFVCLSRFVQPFLFISSSGLNLCELSRASVWVLETCPIVFGESCYFRRAHFDGTPTSGVSNRRGPHISIDRQVSDKAAYIRTTLHIPFPYSFSFCVVHTHFGFGLLFIAYFCVIICIGILPPPLVLIFLPPTFLFFVLPNVQIFPRVLERLRQMGDLPVPRNPSGLGDGGLGGTRGGWGHNRAASGNREHHYGDLL